VKAAHGPQAAGNAPKGLSFRIARQLIGIFKVVSYAFLILNKRLSGECLRCRTANHKASQLLPRRRVRGHYY
jgi:hypothetical protein